MLGASADERERLALNTARSLARAFWPIFVSATVLSACSGRATMSAPGTRTRFNEEHVITYQDAWTNSPIAGISFENGTPGKGDFRADVRVLEFSVLGDVDRASACGVVIERVRETRLSKDPFSELSVSRNGTIERFAAIQCSEKPDSTKLTWSRGHIAMTGHVEYKAYGDDDEWVYHIDHIARAPRIATFEPPDSFAWPSSRD